MSTPPQMPYSYPPPPQNQYPGAYAQQAMPAPPRMHWGLVLLLTLVTLGVFYPIWVILQANWIKKVTGDAKPFNLAAGAAGAYVLYFLAAFTVGGVARIINLAYCVLIIMSVFAIRKHLEQQFGLSLNGAMTFFFGGLYIQSFLSDMNSGYAGSPMLNQQAGQYGQPQQFQQPQYGQQPPQNWPQQAPPQQYGQPQQPQQQQPGQWPPPPPPSGWPPQQ